MALRVRASHDDSVAWSGQGLVWHGYTLAGLHVPLGSFTADLCVVYNSPVTTAIDSPGIVTYLVATYMGPATIRQQGVQRSHNWHGSHARGRIYSTVF